MLFAFKALNYTTPLYISVLPSIILGHLLTIFCWCLSHASKLKVTMPFPLLPLSSGTVSHCTSDPHPHWAVLNPDWSLIFILLYLVQGCKQSRVLVGIVYFVWFYLVLTSFIDVILLLYLLLMPVQWSILGQLLVVLNVL